MSFVSSLEASFKNPRDFRASGSVRRHWHLACLLLPLARVPLVCSSVRSGSPILPDTPSNVGGVLSAAKRVLPKGAGERVATKQGVQLRTGRLAV